METKSKYEFKELENLQNVIDGSKTPEDLKTSVYAMLDRLNRMAKMGNYSQDYEYISSYINWIVSVPWGIDSIESLDIKKTDEMLNREHYGLKSVKERILEYIATRILLTRRAETDSKYEKALKKSPVCRV